MNDWNPFDRVQTYHSDYDLFKESGFELFDIPNREEHFVGQFNFDDESFIKVWVEGFPAQFWKAEIYCFESKKTYVIRTGSGCLSDYWTMFEKVANDMIVIESIQ